LQTHLCTESYLWHFVVARGVVMAVAVAV